MTILVVYLSVFVTIHNLFPIAICKLFSEWCMFYVTWSDLGHFPWMNMYACYMCYIICIFHFYSYNFINSLFVNILVSLSGFYLKWLNFCFLFCSIFLFSLHYICSVNVVWQIRRVTAKIKLAALKTNIRAIIILL